MLDWLVWCCQWNGWHSWKAGWTACMQTRWRVSLITNWWLLNRISYSIKCVMINKWLHIYDIFSYAVDVVLREKQAYQERVSHWCFGVPPRCSKYQIRFRSVNRTQTLKKTRIVRECCGMSRNILIQIQKIIERFF